MKNLPSPPSPSLKRSLHLVGFVAVLFLSACSGISSSVTDSFPMLSSAYAPTSVWYATENGMKTVIHGNPFSVPQAETDGAVLASLRMPAWHQKAEFVAYPKDGRRRGYRLILVFNPLTPISFGDACGNLKEIDVGPTVGLTRIHAAFCTSQRVLSQIYGTVTASGPGDPEFGRLLADALDQLLPPRNFANEDDCKPPAC